jgi:hypothetical protein
MGDYLVTYAKTIKIIADIKAAMNYLIRMDNILRWNGILPESVGRPNFTPTREERANVAVSYAPLYS